MKNKSSENQANETILTIESQAYKVVIVKGLNERKEIEKVTITTINKDEANKTESKEVTTLGEFVDKINKLREMFVLSKEDLNTVFTYLDTNLKHFEALEMLVEPQIIEYCVLDDDSNNNIIIKDTDAILEDSPYSNDPLSRFYVLQLIYEHIANNK